MVSEDFEYFRDSVLPTLKADSGHRSLEIRKQLHDFLINEANFDKSKVVNYVENAVRFCGLNWRSDPTHFVGNLERGKAGLVPSLALVYFAICVRDWREDLNTLYALLYDSTLTQKAVALRALNTPISVQQAFERNANLSNGGSVSRALLREDLLPRLTNAPFSEIPSHHGHQLLKDLTGRDTQFERLRLFLAAEGRFRWLQVAGAAGQGKSRISSELVEFAKENGWHAGFLMSKHLADYLRETTTWVPGVPCLMVIDYVIGHLPQTRELIQRLISHSHSFKNKVRLLLVERQRWDRAGIATSDTGGPSFAHLQQRAGWFLDLTERSDGNDPDISDARFEDGVVEMLGLDEHQILGLIKDVHSRMNADFNLPPDKELYEHFLRIDAQGRPLYAYLLAQAFAAGAVRPDWKKGQLLFWIVNTDQENRWRSVYGDDMPERGNLSDAGMRLALIATIAGEIDCRNLSRKIGWSRVNAAIRKRALCLVGNDTGRPEWGTDQVIRKLEPDLIGEWFVLNAIEAGASAEVLMRDAWALSPAKTSEFIERVILDFPDHVCTADIVNAVPSGSSAASVYRLSSPSYVAAFLSSKVPPTRTLFDELEAAADNGHLQAMDRLAYCLCIGRGKNQDRTSAFRRWKIAADAGHVQAMANVGLCYQYRLGCDKNMIAALEYYRNAASQGNGWAMANIGLCYKHGDGVDQDPAKAVKWLKDSAELSEGWGISNLGRCYQEGFGCSPNATLALQHYERAVALGDGRAMAFLGECYENGIAVEQDITLAIQMYRKGLQAIDGLAMANLGKLYFGGIGVPRRRWRAVSLYAKGARMGNGDASYLLGRCFENGDVVQKSRITAIHHYKRAADYFHHEAIERLKELGGESLP